MFQTLVFSHKNCKKIPEIPGIDEEYPAGHQQRKFWQFTIFCPTLKISDLENIRLKSLELISIFKHLIVLQEWCIACDGLKNFLGKSSNFWGCQIIFFCCVGFKWTFFLLEINNEVRNTFSHSGKLFLKLTQYIMFVIHSHIVITFLSM